MDSHAVSGGPVDPSVDDAARAALSEFEEEHGWFHSVMEIQAAVLARVNERRGSPLAPARTKHSDAGAVYTMVLPEKGLFVRTHTLSGGAVDWAYQSSALAKGMGFTYTKTGMFPATDTATPNLDIEIGGTAQELIFWASMSPRLDVVGHPEYVERYYSSPPRPGMPTFVELEKVAAGQAEFTRFTSPSIMVRVLAATAMPFTAAPTDGALAAMRRDALAVTDLWLSWIEVDEEQRNEGAGGAGSVGPAAGPPHRDLASRYPEELRARTAMMRDVQRRDPALPPQRAVFGDAAVEAWLESLSGQARL